MGPGHPAPSSAEPALVVLPFPDPHGRSPVSGANLSRSPGDTGFCLVQAGLLCRRRGNFLAPVIRRVFMPPRFGFPIPLRDPKLQERQGHVGDRGDLFGRPSSEHASPLISWGARVSLHPSNLRGPPPSSSSVAIQLRPADLRYEPSVHT
jgi:hypothetical protein